ncbi:prolactin-7C1-like [Nannospalax galili]|uniref:Prolactin n=1 Tax=Nannospalax galili TaxID=1026970 RepID=A0A8C6R4Z5_NANGA|nr:prolactin-7C1-like [Nannospalax galili]
MPRSLTNSSSARVLLLLLVSDLLLWEEVVSVPMHAKDTDHEEVTLQELFDHAITLSQNISDLATDMRMEFFTNDFSSKLFNKFMLRSTRDMQFMANTLNTCHTLSINTPETIQEAKEISLDDFLKMTLSIVQAWNVPLHHLVTELSGMPGAPSVILSRAKDIEAENKELLMRVKKILSKVHPGIEENVSYPLWSDLAHLQAADEEVRMYTLYKMSYCLRVDMHTVDLYLKLLRCLHVNGDVCYSTGFGDDAK